MDKQNAPNSEKKTEITKCCTFERRQIRNLNETFGLAKMPTVHKFHSKLNNNYKYLFI